MRKALIVASAAGLLAACLPLAQPGGPIHGKPVDELVNDLKDDLAEVHWRIRTARPACGTTAAREVDLRQASVVLTLERVAQTTIGGDVRLVAVPLGALALAPVTADYDRRAARTIVMKLEAAGTAPLVDLDTARPSTRPVAQALNAAIDGFMRSSADEPCVRLASLKLTLVVDVARDAGGGFRLVVPAAQVGVDASRRDVNTLTLSWDKVVSNALR